MVLPEFQGRGLGKQGVRMLLEPAREDGRWRLVHAFPATGNTPSNGIRRSLGFRHLGEGYVSLPAGCSAATTGSPILVPI